MRYVKIIILAIIQDQKIVYSEAVSLTKNVDIDKYKHTGYGIRFDRKGEISVGNGIGRNVIILE